MPYIGGLKQGQRLQVNSPVPIGESNSARRMGSAIADLGDGVTNLGTGVDNFVAAKQQTEKNLLLGAARNELERANQEAYDESLRALPGTDGSMASKVFDEGYKKRTEEILKKYDGADSQTRRAIMNLAGQAPLESRARIMGAAREQFTKFAVDQTETTKNQGLANIRMNPEAFDKETDGYSKFLIGMPALVTPNMVQPMMKDFVQDAAVEAVRGYIDQNSFDIAREKVAAHGEHFDIKVREQLINEIDSASIKHLNRQNAEFDRNERLTAKQREDSQRANFGAIYTEIPKAKTNNQRISLEKRIDMMGAQDGLTTTQVNFLKTQMRETTGTADDNQSFRIASRLIKGDNYHDIEKDVMNTTNAGLISSARGTALLNSLITHRNREEADPVYKNKLKRSNELMDAAFPRDAMTNMFQPGGEQMKVDAMLLRDQYIVGGMEPEEASRKAIKMFAPGVKSLPLVPGVDFSLQNDLKGLDQAAKVIEQRYKGDNAGRLDAFRKLKARKDAIILEEQINQAVTPQKQGQ